MQTFLPYPEFPKSAACLDYRRLGKQRVETLQILQALFNEKQGWRNHPAVKMWSGHELWLVQYGLIICDEWIPRGYKDTCKGKIRAYEQKSSHLDRSRFPTWLHDPYFHRSHQSNLVRKDPIFYGPKFPGVPHDLPYIWPEGAK